MLDKNHMRNQFFETINAIFANKNLKKYSFHFLCFDQKQRDTPPEKSTLSTIKMKPKTEIHNRSEWCSERITPNKLSNIFQWVAKGNMLFLWYINHLITIRLFVSGVNYEQCPQECSCLRLQHQEDCFLKRIAIVPYIYQCQNILK